MRRGRRRWLFLVAAAAALALIIPAIVRVSTPEAPSRVTVLTRNLYLGGDITRPVRAALGRTGADAVLALGQASHELREIVDRTDFPTRSRLLATEIAAARPDLIALQEVALWRHGPIERDQIGRPNATEVDYDFLATLLADLEDHGVGYDVAAQQQGSDVEAPAFEDAFDGEGRDVRLTLQDVILIRQDSPVRVTGRGGGGYQQRLDIDLGGATFSFQHGYAWADAEVGQQRLRFIATHLESQSAEVALVQAEELLSGPAAGEMTTVLGCDCNSAPGSPAYALLTDHGRLADQWLEAPGDPGSGFTAILGELVNDPTAVGLNRRIDLVLARPAAGRSVTPARVQLTGHQPADRSDSGLWPSDHAGVVVELEIGD
ncbi:MAG TPA: endonuclease/exonuclease/phosphatase family protein [Propionibacteriaceae bacterium]|nr:endonuclease/exonuclease/phosphatase family protein [Propionibacteriaceae bacterium]